MATRPVFVAVEAPPFHSERIVEFTWHAGFAKSQAQKSIAELHAAAGRQGFGPVLEISSKSANPLGVSLSAFNLRARVGNLPEATVESLFQSAKVFRQQGPFPEFLALAGRTVKADPRLRDSGPLVAFELDGRRYPLQPRTAFYDWLYTIALLQRPDTASKLEVFNAFTDIAFNPKKSLNCQARAAARYVGLRRAALVESATRSFEAFLGAAY